MFALFAVGLYCAAAKQNVIKIIIGLVVMEYSVVLLFVAFGYTGSGIDPNARMAAGAVLAAGLAATAMLCAVAMRLYERFRTFDIKQIRKLKG